MADFAAVLAFFAPAFLAGFFAATFFLAGAFLAVVDFLALVAFLALGMAHILPLCGPARKIRNTRFKKIDKKIDMSAGTGAGV